MSVTTGSSTIPAAGSTTPALGFSSLEREVVLDELALRGELPRWLTGSLLRTGPAKFEVAEQQMKHWFDGLAMLHRFTISQGRVSYGSRFLEGHSYTAAREQGRMVYGEFATDPCRSLFKRVQTLFTKTPVMDNANVNVSKLGGRFVAMTESSLPVQFDSRTLAAARVHPYEAPGQLSTAHPHRDRATGSMLNYAAQLGPRSTYRFFEVAGSGIAEPGAKPRVIASLPVSKPAYMHSFGLTERWFVLAEFPFVVNPLALAVPLRPYIENYRWKPERGTRFTLVDRVTGKATAGFQTDACFAFHHVNAYEDGGEVVVDLCTVPDASVIQDLYLERLRDADCPLPRPTFTRFRLKLADRSVRREQIGDGGLELPRINYARSNERPYRYTWGVDLGASGWFEDIVKLDISGGAARSWSEPGCYPGEPVFVANPDGEDEDDGVLLSVVLDARAGNSFLLVLDAGDLSEKARAEVPHHIPFGFHGMFART